jgi:hypothetical protein
MTRTAPDLMSALMAERIAYGGLAATRLQVYLDITERLPDAPSVGIGSADWWAFSPPALSPAETARMPHWEDCPH